MSLGADFPGSLGCHQLETVASLEAFPRGKASASSLTLRPSPRPATPTSRQMPISPPLLWSANGIHCQIFKHEAAGLVNIVQSGSGDLITLLVSFWEWVVGGLISSAAEYPRIRRRGML